ncbi:MAG: glycoside hydrolase family 43 protein [Porticoccaceae bacterium]|nr:glycoside hydrolase family 43 protein [Porticoccaceae bacterium]
MATVSSRLGRGIVTTLAALILCSQGHSDSPRFVNPILAGGYPDPSICRVDSDYYLVNSTFEYFPGLPLHHSKDLVNWELVGYGLHRSDQVISDVNLVDVQSDGGIHAPTLRCHKGVFYIITTNVYSPPKKSEPTEFVNFIITADNIAGPWSQPHVIEGAPGIDPDLFFDDDGSAWYVGTHTPEIPNFNGEGEIWLQQLDLGKWALVGERHYLWRGALIGAIWAEGPHLYKRDGRYYLMVAEGGTSFDHAVTIAVGDAITGPYVGNPRNPILTSRHLSYDNWVHSTGHADLLELSDGRWYMVALGVRGDESRGSNMGRETHLVPIVWEREPYPWKTKSEWPVAAPFTGKVERYNALPMKKFPQHRKLVFSDNFDSPTLGLQWNFRRLPIQDIFSLIEHPGYFRLYSNPATPQDRGRASLIGFRQTESDFIYQAKMQFAPADNNVNAGLSVFQKDNNYLSYTIVRHGDGYQLELALASPDKAIELLKRHSLKDYAGQIQLRVTSKDHRYVYSYSMDDGNTWVEFTKTAADLLISRGYTGAYLGFYSTSNGVQSKDYMDIDWVNYAAYERH